MTKAKLDKIFGTIAILVLVSATYLTFSGTSIAGKINLFQALILGDGKYYPVLTIAILLIPIFIILVPLKIILVKRLANEKRINQK